MKNDAVFSKSLEVPTAVSKLCSVRINPDLCI